ncbi:FG-GAP-like repeat-containing protein [Rubripirellula amarantea]|uniref:FG-GAP-like repeat-containing protein n=1 Tax=Rubripirellula amarantea TaxID=2527999 RepID=UPI0013EEEBA5|nr:FG-GAP-like repeat-containing protein [Rubripirellula amarantea]
MFFVLIAGCKPSVDTPATSLSSDAVDLSPREIDPIANAKLALSQGNALAAKQSIRTALLQNPDDVSVLRLAGEIAFANKEPDQGCDFLVSATRLEKFADSDWLNRAVVALVSVGKLYEAIDLLDHAVAKHPERHELRRLLFDFLINAEEHFRAVPHGQQLVRERHFDRVLLFSLSTTEQRNLEETSMDTLVQRNPSDPRLKLASVRGSFDRGNWEESIESDLLSILDYSPTNIPAQYLLGRYYVESNQFEKLKGWADRVTSQSEQTWQHWSILGDWAFHRGDFRGAVRAYWESTRRNIDIGEVLAKLARVLSYLQSHPNELDGLSIDPATITAVNNRAVLLSRFMQDKERYYKLGNRSNAIAADVARSLAALGRYWEAEAWAAMAMTKPDQDIAKLKQVRSEIIKKLRPDLPWQTTEEHPVTQLDLSRFAKPDVEMLAGSVTPSSSVQLKPSIRPTLHNEAKIRGVNIPQAFRRDRKGGIPIYAQMESGGCAIDYDLDGWPDLYVGSSGGTPGERDSNANYLFRNLQGNFENVSNVTGADDVGFAQGVTFGDVNEDGFHDLLVMNYGLDRLFINNGDGTFSNGDHWLETANPVRWSTCAAVADLDGDGISDLVRTHYCVGLDAVETPCHDMATGLESPCLPTKFSADIDTFCTGTATGEFIDATEQWQAIPLHPGRGLGLVVGSLDQTIGNDVFVANDMTNNHYWTGAIDDQGQFSMTESATLRGLALDGRFRPQACMGIAVADLNQDGSVDLFVTNFEQEHNTFYEQTRPGIWADQTDIVGLKDTSFDKLGFGTQAVDFDNDSLHEIAIANGHVYIDADPPATYAQKMQILRRESSSLFGEFQFGASDGYLDEVHVGRGLWSMDVNRDGKVDMAITHQTEPLALLVNHTAADGHFLRVKLVGVRATRDPIGAVVRVTWGNVSRMAPLVTGDGFYCANERTLHFGLGSDGDVNSNAIIKITWPDSSMQSFSAKVDREYLIVEGDREPFGL